MDQSDKQPASAKRAPETAAAAADESAAKRAKGNPTTLTAMVAAAAAAAAASTAVALSASIAAVSSPLPIAQCCNHDCLSVVFSFCEGLRVMVSAAQTCRHWYAAAGRRQSSCRTEGRWKWERILQMLQSPLRVHLCAVHVFCGTVTADQLLQIFAGCPQLEKLFVEVDDESINTLTESTDGTVPFHAHTWPSSLRTVQFSLRDFGIDL
jgi:hypothetical protein